MGEPQTKRMRPDSSRRKPAKGRYIYALVLDSADKTFGFTGINEHPVYTLALGGVASVVSDLDADAIRPERRHLAAHRAVLGKLMEREDAVLPMRFGSLAAGPAEITRLLSRNHDLFARQLRRVAGKVEMGIRVFWDVPNIFEYFVNTHPELKEMRDSLFRGPDPPSQQRQIDLGRMFERLLNEDREAHTRAVEEAMAPRCCEIKRSAVREEREILNLACLVDRRRRDDFENGVFQAAHGFDNNFAFDYNGPWAPHAFAEMSLKAS